MVLEFTSGVNYVLDAHDVLGAMSSASKHIWDHLELVTYIPHPVVTTSTKYKATYKARGEQHIFECTYKLA